MNAIERNPETADALKKYPEGVSQHSPGLPGSPGYPGFEVVKTSTLKGLHSPPKISIPILDRRITRPFERSSIPCA
jgi:hypothetical protein